MTINYRLQRILCCTLLLSLLVPARAYADIAAPSPVEMGFDLLIYALPLIVVALIAVLIIVKLLRKKQGGTATTTNAKHFKGR